MHPAYSVILFTTASGAGLGLLAWLALLAMLDAVSADRWLGVVGLGLAFVLVASGLIASTAHLGRPERAWRAFSQWRTSWLSREGLMAVATVLPAGVLGVGWVGLESVDGLFAVAAALTVACAVFTLYCTGMIYASLRTIRQWYQPLTAPIYVALGLASGAVLLHALLVAFGEAVPRTAWLAIFCTAVGAALKWAYWLRIDGELRTYTAEAATGARPPRQGACVGAATYPAQLRHARDGLSRRAQARAEAAQAGAALRLRLAHRLSAAVASRRHCAGERACRRPVDGRWARHGALAVLRRGRARGDAVLWGGCGLTLGQTPRRTASTPDAPLCEGSDPIRTQTVPVHRPSHLRMQHLRQHLGHRPVAGRGG